MYVNSARSSSANRASTERAIFGPPGGFRVSIGGEPHVHVAVGAEPVQRDVERAAFDLRLHAGREVVTIGCGEEVQPQPLLGVRSSVQAIESPASGRRSLSYPTEETVSPSRNHNCPLCSNEAPRSVPNRPNRFSGEIERGHAPFAVVFAGELVHLVSGFAERSDDVSHDVCTSRSKLRWRSHTTYELPSSKPAPRSVSAWVTVGLPRYGPS